MTDREKVIKRLEECLSASCRGFRTCPYSDDPDWDAVEAALALLRDRETTIVRCKNCRHYDMECITDGCGWCNHRDFGTNDEWYCADGEAGTYADD